MRDSVEDCLEIPQGGGSLSPALDGGGDVALPLVVVPPRGDCAVVAEGEAVAPAGGDRRRLPLDQGLGIRRWASRNIFLNATWKAAEHVRGDFPLLDRH